MSLALNNLALSFGDVPLFSQLDCTLKTGEIACLLGASGCGKTTVLRCISGFETPSAGRIVMDDVVFFDADASVKMPAHLRQVGMVFQDYALFSHLTVAENIRFGIKHLPKNAQQARVAELLSLIDMTDLGSRYPHKLSGGQQQRVALARALAPKPKLVLLDEPFSNLDVDLRTALSKEVRRLLKAENVSAIMVTHDQAEAFVMADVVGVMAKGRLQQWDVPSALYHTPASSEVASFIGDGVLLPVIEHRANQALTFFGEVFCANLTTAHTQVLVRPEHVQLTALADGECVVVDRDFRGGHWLCTLKRAGDEVGVSLLGLVNGATDIAVGDRVSVRINQGWAV